MLGRQDGVLASLKQRHRNVDRAEPVLVDLGVGLRELAVLAVVGGLAVGAEPRREERLEHPGSEPEMGGVAQVRGDQGFVGVAGQLSEDVRLGADLGEQTALPGAAADGVEEGEVAVADAVDQYGAQRDGSADVVGDDARELQLPVPKERGQATALGGQAEILALNRLGGAVAEVVEDLHGVPRRERGGDVTPQERRVRGPVHEHDRRSRPDPCPPHEALVGLEPLGQGPVHGYPRWSTTEFDYRRALMVNGEHVQPGRHQPGRTHHPGARLCTDCQTQRSVIY